MTICTIDAVVTIENDRKLVLQLPPEVRTGRHRVVATVGDTPEPASRLATEAWGFPVLLDAQWPDNMPLSRDEMYDDDGR
jgi:hypothetical protein